MNDTVSNALAVSLAGLEQVLPVPSGELGYGVDLSCVTDCDADLTEVDPRTPLGIGQALCRRLTTRRGSLPDDPNYGLDLRAYCNHGITAARLVDVGGQVRLEVAKDDRVDSALVTVTQPTPATLRVVIEVVPAVLGLRPFTLTFALADGVAALEAING